MTAGHGYGRRRFLEMSGGSLLGVSAAGLLACAGPRLRGPTQGIGYFARFGVTERLLSEVLGAALARGGEHAELFFQHRVRNELRLAGSNIRTALSAVELGVGVRVVDGDQTGYGFTEDLSRAALLACAQTAAAIADGPARPGPSRFRVEGRVPNRYTATRRWADVAGDEKLRLLRFVSARAFEVDPRVKKVSVRLGDEAAVVMIADSSGRIVEDVQPMTFLELGCVAEQNGHREENEYGVAGRAGLEFYDSERLDRVIGEAVGRTLVLFDAVAPPLGEMPVVLSSASSGILLHEAIGHGMEADFARSRVSIYSDRIGKPIAKPFVHIVDDATGPGGRGAINVDDEGNTAGVTRLVDGGVLASYLHDAVSARHYGVPATGNGRRESYRYPPLPRMHSTYMLPGPHRRDEIIRTVKKGVLCDSFSNGEVSIGGGDFSFYVKNGWLIENGKVTWPIKDVNVVGNGPKVLERIDMVADDLGIDEGLLTCRKQCQAVPVSYGLPTVRVSSMAVGGRVSARVARSTQTSTPARPWDLARL